MRHLLQKVSKIVRWIPIFQSSLSISANHSLSLVPKGLPEKSATYIELNDRIERMSKSMQNFLVKYTSALFVIPALMTGLINYFILDLGEESFQNDSPMKYVSLQAKYLPFSSTLKSLSMIEIDSISSG